MAQQGNTPREPNPVFLMLAELARMTYGDALNYLDHPEYADRAEAAVALCESGAIRRRATRDKRTGRVLAWTYSVVSQDKSNGIRHYSVSADAMPDCDCADWQHRMRRFRGELERVGSQAITLPCPVPCKHALALRWMLALQSIFPSITIEDEGAEQAPVAPVAPARTAPTQECEIGKSVRVPLDDPELEEMCNVFSANNYDPGLDKRGGR